MIKKFVVPKVVSEKNVVRSTDLRATFFRKIPSSKESENGRVREDVPDRLAVVVVVVVAVRFYSKSITLTKVGVFLNKGNERAAAFPWRRARSAKQPR